MVAYAPAYINVARLRADLCGTIPGTIPGKIPGKILRTVPDIYVKNLV